jgi:hypothetical protein
MTWRCGAQAEPGKFPLPKELVTRIEFRCNLFAIVPKGKFIPKGVPPEKRVVGITEDPGEIARITKFLKSVTVASTKLPERTAPFGPISLDYTSISALKLLTKAGATDYVMSRDGRYHLDRHEHIPIVNDGALFIEMLYDVLSESKFKGWRWEVIKLESEQ